MASKTSLRETATRASIRSPLRIRTLPKASIYLPPPRRRWLSQTPGPWATLNRGREFSTSAWRSLAQVNEGIPQQEREVDDVDVCIVGGGIHFHLH